MTLTISAPVGRSQTAPARARVDALRALIQVRLLDSGRAPVRTVGLRPSEYSTSAPIEEVSVELADGSHVELMAKKLGRASLIGDAGLVKPEMIYDSRREPLMYALLAGEEGPPRCWGMLDEPDGAVLVLERVDGFALRHIGELAVWCAAATWLGRFHDRWREPTEIVDPLRSRLVRYDHDHHRRLFERALHFSTGSGLFPEAHIARALARALDVLDGIPSGLVHGEFYASNVLANCVDGVRIAALDWEMAGIGSPFLDLAALVSGDWKPRERDEICTAYRRACGLALSDAEFDQALVAAEVLIGIQWVGWAVGWLPPDDLARDWAAYAVAKAGLLWC